ncbi:MAG: hypothetical protein ACJ71N_13450 [Terriglobales bacterium]
MSLPVLVFVHNHRFEENIARLEKIYASRFSRIHHVMPFYRGKQPNVHGVYEASHQFQGYFAQASNALLAENASHYIFCGDDLMLNPRLDENNLIPELGLSSESGYMKAITALSSVPFSWPHMAGAILAFVQNTGVDWQRELPSSEEASAALKRHGIAMAPLSLSNFREGVGPRQFLELLFCFAKRIQARRFSLTELPYPLATTYSDFFVVPGTSLGTFCHLCGVFAGMNLFAEVAIPTALLMSCEHVLSEEKPKMHGYELWTKSEIAELESSNGCDLKRLFATFPDERLYLHPVKLSRWTI